MARETSICTWHQDSAYAEESEWSQKFSRIFNLRPVNLAVTEREPLLLPRAHIRKPREFVAPHLRTKTAHSRLTISLCLTWELLKTPLPFARHGS